MFQRQPSEIRRIANDYIKKGNPDGYCQSGIESLIKLNRKAIALLNTLPALNNDDHRNLARCSRANAYYIRSIYDESRGDDFETQCRHPLYIKYLKQGIYHLDAIPFTQQTPEDREHIDLSIDDIEQSCFYFGMPHEEVLGERLLRLSEKYDVHNTKIQLMDRLAQLFPDHHAEVPLLHTKSISPTRA